MFQTIEKIVAILNGYGYGKLVAIRRKSKFEGKGKVKDLVSISDEARKRCKSGEDEVIPPHIDETYMK
jgi:hypothetical protein